MASPLEATARLAIFETVPLRSIASPHHPDCPTDRSVSLEVEFDRKISAPRPVGEYDRVMAFFFHRGWLTSDATHFVADCQFMVPSQRVSPPRRCRPADERRLQTSFRSRQLHDCESEATFHKFTETKAPNGLCSVIASLVARHTVRAEAVSANKPLQKPVRSAWTS